MNRTHAKVLKSLETKKLIRSFKSVTSKFKKFYIIADLDQADYHKGGIWYNSDLEFDEDFVKILTERCFEYIRKHGYATLESVREYINQIKVSKVEICSEDTKKLINTLIYSGLVESLKNTDPALEGEMTYKPSKHPMPKNGLTSVPCGICSITHLCGRTIDVTPQNCVYMKQWLEF